MLYHPRDLDAGKDHRFSFANTDYENADDSGYSRTDQRVMGSHDYYIKRSHNMRIRTWPRKNSENEEEQYGNRYGSEFQGPAEGEKEDDDDPGVPSPKMVKVISPVDRTKKEETYPEFHHSHRHEKICYPSTRSETIARYQKEMMELVRDVPESGYELSLRDIVELPKIINAVKEDVIQEELQQKEKEEPIRGKKQLFRNETFSHSPPVMLNFFLSINYGKSSRSGIIGSKVCPKPPNEKSGVEKSMSSKSRNNNDSGYGEIGSKASSSNHKSKKMTGCFPFISTITWSRKKVQRRPHTLT